jgi:hypothetical protein
MLSTSGAARRGRPARAGERSNVRIVIYVTASEARALAALGKVSKQTREGYVRDLAVSEAGDYLETCRK